MRNNSQKEKKENIMPTVKIPNYTEKQADELVNAYIAVDTDPERIAVVESFMAKFGKKKASIVAKLTREKVYIKPEKVTKNGKVPVRKDSYVAKISKEIGVDEDQASSLIGTTKNVLERIEARFQVLNRNLEMMEGYLEDRDREIEDMQATSK